jgi:hypothetical protein
MKIQQIVMKVSKVLLFLVLFSNFCFSQTYKIGEKITYNVSFGSIKEAGYAEIFVVSSGKLKGEDAIELQAKFKTINLLSAIYPINQTRICYISTKTGLPLYNRIIFQEEMIPREKIENFLENPTKYHNLITALYQIRSGANNINFQEDGKIYTLSWQIKAKKKVKTDIGEFDSLILNVQSNLFDEWGIKDFQLGLTDDSQKIPISMSFKNEKGLLAANIASFQIVEQEPKEIPKTEPTPTPTPTPRPTPTPYIENQPLSKDLPFVLGEALSYKLSHRNEEIGTVVLQAKERVQIGQRDSLVLMATVTQIKPQTFLSAGDVFTSQVDPFVLTPFTAEARLKTYREVVSFNQELGFASLDTNKINIPVGTHSLLSLAYAIRAFVFPSTEKKLQDVRVAVFFNKKYYIITLRPSGQEEITFGDRKIMAQIISISANIPNFDRLNAKVWLSNDAARLPLRFTIGNFSADLKLVEVIPPKTKQ